MGIAGGQLGAPDILFGIRVLEIAEGIAGPMAGMMLAEFGANVVKVEPIGGDWSRTLGPPFVAGHSPAYLAVNVGKRSFPVALDTARGRQIVQHLAASSDVVIEGYRPGVAEKLGVDHATLAQDNPDLVYVDISGYGSTGPAAGLPGSDTIIQAYAGLMSVTGDLGGDACRVGTPIADTAAGVYGALAALLGLVGRERGGGRQMSVSLLESLLALQSVSFADYFASQQPPQPLGARSSLFAAPAQAYPTSDGHLMVSCHAPRQWARFCDAVGRPEWRDDKRFSTNHDRVKHLDDLTQEISAVLQERTTEEWLSLFRANGVNAGPIQDYAEVAADPQVDATGAFQKLKTDAYGEITYTRTPTASQHGAGRPLPPPLLGEGTRDLLVEMGFSQDEIEGLEGDQIVGAPPEYSEP